MSRLVLKNLTKKFDEVVAVDHVNLEVEEGEFVTLLGPSGCGKTTTLRIIAGFYVPDEGEVYFNDRLMNNVPPNRRNTAMCFQSYALFPHMNVWENIAFGLKMRKIPEAEQKKRVQKALEMLSLVGFEKRKPGQLSGGQQQRVALARAIVTEPDILLFDEPLSNLDAKLRVQVRVEIREMQKRLGITSIYVTHDQDEALAISDRIVVMNQGRIEQVGDPHTIYLYPKTAFVAGFIGIANIFTGRVLKREGNRLLLEAAFGQVWVWAEGSESKIGDEVRFSFRPEDMVLYREGMVNRIRGTIVHAIFMGDSTDLFVEVKGQRLRARGGNLSYSQNVWKLKPGDVVDFGVEETAFRILS
ncbi:MAG: ABC transporter ATP-binding protein [Spirochaetes bacterium]|nr:ABC transporter ATP-binding protein [Spirochaetota bacterium]